MSRRAFFVLLLLSFLDSAAFGLVYPLFCSMLFDPKWAMVDPSTSSAIRGLWVGLSISVTPIVTMLVSPVVGNLSDKIGRRPTILSCLSFGAVAWFLAGVSVMRGLLPGLILARGLLGISAASFAVANACIADKGDRSERGWQYAWMGVAFGLGFALGPLLGGLFSSRAFGEESLVRPFWISSFLTALNTFLVYLWLPETSAVSRENHSPSLVSFVKELFHIERRLLLLLLAIFLFCFGWSFYLDVIPVWWVTQFHMDTTQVSLFFGYGALWYVSSCAFLVGRVIRRFSSLTILAVASALLFVFIWVLLFRNSPASFWCLLPLQNIAASFLFPVAATASSEMATDEHRGKTMGYYTSAESLGFGMGPLTSGVFLGVHLLMPVVLGGLAMLAASLIFASLRKSRAG